MAHLKRFTYSLIILLFPVLSFSAGNPGFNGQWTLIPQKSSEIALYGTLSLEFQQNASKLILIQKWGAKRGFSDTLSLKTGNVDNTVPITNRVFPSNVFMGLSMPVGSSRHITANWQNNGMTLNVQDQYMIRGSQGESPETSTYTY